MDDNSSSSHWPITLTNGAAALFNLFLPLALVRILSLEEVGRYKIFSLYIMLGPGLFLSVGLTNGLYHWAGKYPGAKAEVRQSWSLLLALVAALSLAGLAFSPRLSAHLGVPGLDFRLFLVCAPVLLASVFLEDLMIAQGRIWTGSLYASLFSVVRAAAVLGAAWWTRRVDSVLWALLAATAARLAAGVWMMRGSEETRPLFSRHACMNVLRYAAPVSAAALAALAFQNMDQMVLSVRLVPEKFALYAMGCLSVPPLQVFETSVNRVLIPRLSRAFGGGDLARAAALVSEGMAELFRFLLPAAAGLMIYAHPIIRVLFTERYAAAAEYLRFYALFYLFFSIPFDVVARARGDGGWILRTSLLFAPISIGATWLAAGRWGAMGALAAYLSVQLLLRLYALVYQRFCLASPIRKFLPLREMAVQTGLALGAAAAVLLLRPLFRDSRTWFFVTGPLFTAAYFAGTWVARGRRADPGPIRVLELAQTLGLGGLERMLYSLSAALNRDGLFKVLVVTYDHPAGTPSLKPQFEEAGIPLVQWEKGDGFSFRNVFRLVRTILSEKSQIVHAHDLGPLMYGSLAKLLSPNRVRLFLTLHTLLQVEKSARYRAYFKLFLRFPDRIIAVSPGVKAGLTALGVKPERVEVIPNGAAFPAAPASPRERNDLRGRLMPGAPPALREARWLLCLARVHPGKGQNTVLEVWRALPAAARAGLALFFVGQETDAEYGQALRQSAALAPDGDRVILPGPSDRPDEWIRASDIFISGSDHEGMPLAPLEALGAGLPTVLSDIEGHRFLMPWAHRFDPRRPADGAGRVLDILERLEADGERPYAESRWRATEPLRRRWAAPAMTASYAGLFQNRKLTL